MMKYCLVYPFFRCVCVRERRNDTTRSKKNRIKRRKENTEDFTRKIEKKKKEGERIRKGEWIMNLFERKIVSDGEEYDTS